LDGTRILHFPLGARRVGLSISEVREISEIPPPTPVPGAPAEIAGIVEIRGRIVTLMDIARIQGVPAQVEAGQLAVQLAPPYAHLGILVPGRVERLETGSASLDPHPRPSHGDGRSGSHSCGRDDREQSPLGRETVVGGRPIYLLDVHALFRFCSMRVREGFRVAE
jgi:purine-binding chemotaxis protein CheW